MPYSRHNLIRRLQKLGLHLMASSAEGKNAVNIGRERRPRIILHDDKISKRTMRKTMERWEARTGKKAIHGSDRIILGRQLTASEIATRHMMPEIIRQARQMKLTPEQTAAVQRLFGSKKIRSKINTLSILRELDPDLMRVHNMLGDERTTELLLRINKRSTELLKTAREVNKERGAKGDALINPLVNNIAASDYATGLLNDKKWFAARVLDFIGKCEEEARSPLAQQDKLFLSKIKKNQAEAKKELAIFLKKTQPTH